MLQPQRAKYHNNNKSKSKSKNKKKRKNKNNKTNNSNGSSDDIKIDHYTIHIEKHSDINIDSDLDIHNVHPHENTLR